jgi:hypothetical protein
MTRVRGENLERYRAAGRKYNKTEKAKAGHIRKQRKKRESEGPRYRKAHNTIHRAIEAGKLIRPDHCSRCEVQCFPQAHHDDYNKPLSILWLCPICHAQRHKELGRLRRVYQQ